jgi:hypothetical protein
VTARSTLTIAMVVIVCTASLTGCGSLTTNATADNASPPPSAAGLLPTDDPNAPVAGAGTCHMGSDQGQSLPDPRCTPGVINPSVTQAAITTTICKSGWTATIRPPASYTNKLKREQITAYGDTDTHTTDYEEDHLVSLELGGGPDDPRNLWPEPHPSPNPKDKIENDLHRAVCSHRITLAAAQTAIASDWTTAETRLGLSS